MKLLFYIDFSSVQFGTIYYLCSDAQSLLNVSTPNVRGHVTNGTSDLCHFSCDVCNLPALKS